MSKGGRQEWFRYLRLEGKSYRRPKGKQSAKRCHLRGKIVLPGVGYGAQSSEKGLHPCGLREILISTPGQLVEGGDFVVRIGGTVGHRKALAIVEKAKSLNLRVLNPPRARKVKPKAEKKAGPAKPVKPKPAEHKHATHKEHEHTHTHKHEHKEEK